MTKRRIQGYSAWLEAGFLGVLALGLRVWGIGFDLPLLYCPVPGGVDVLAIGLHLE